MPNLVWFREDLRVTDNTALFHAAKSDNVIALFIIDFPMWKTHKLSNTRIEFLLAGVQALKTELQKLNIPLIIKTVKTHTAYAKLILNIMRQCNTPSLFYNKQYEVDELRRDEKVAITLEKNNLSVYAFHDQCILEPGIITKKNKTPYLVFTPYKRAWKEKLNQYPLHLLPKIKRQTKITCSLKSDKLPTLNKNSLWPAGSQAAQKRFKKFLKQAIFDYDRNRDFPFLNGTSKLSPYLATGMISPRECFLVAYHLNHNKMNSGQKGIVTWINELVWRDFYKHLLFFYPRLSMNQPFNLKTKKIIWNNNRELFNAWKNGKTGYPIIDAAMRQLKQENWMHNRLRMLVASFLTKNLFINWQWGEAYFSEMLIDYDLAANNGGWQWCASTGTDAVPYFRIFNPIKQSQTYDKEGTFIKKYCPELKKFDKKSVHDPHLLNPVLAEQVNYPKPIISRDYYRKNVLASFKRLNDK